MSGKTKTAPFRSTHPIMIYVHNDEVKAFKDFAKSMKKSLSRVAREAIRMQMSGEKDQYSGGFNDGLSTAINVLKKNSWANMVLPSGEPLWKVICDDIQKQQMNAIEPKLKDPWDLVRES